MKKFFKENSLTIVLFSLFFIFLVGLSITGYLHENEELSMHAQPSITYLQYLGGSEFLAVGMLILLS